LSELKAVIAIASTVEPSSTSTIPVGWTSASAGATGVSAAWV
jgi:hypothetical protein